MHSVSMRPLCNRVEGLSFRMPDRMSLQAGEGETVSFVRVRKDQHVATGFVRDVSAAIVWLYDEAPPRIELDTHSNESIVRSRWTCVCGGQVEIESVEVAPAPPGDRTIALLVWVLPPQETDKGAKQ